MRASATLGQDQGSLLMLLDLARLLRFNQSIRGGLYGGVAQMIDKLPNPPSFVKYMGDFFAVFEDLEKVAPASTWNAGLFYRRQMVRVVTQWKHGCSNLTHADRL